MKKLGHGMISFTWLLMASQIESKPLNHPVDFANKIDYESQYDYKVSRAKSFESEDLLTSTISSKTFDDEKSTDDNGDDTNDISDDKKTSDQQNSDLLTGDQTSEENLPTSSTTTENILHNNNKNKNKNDNQEYYNSNSNNWLGSILTPLFQKFQFSPQAFLQDRLGALKELLTNVGLVLPYSQQSASKQFANLNKLLNFIGLDDSGFYTDRLEPGGLLDGNGWFSNKGGLLGGPGAIVSTGPILTDYPTPYRKK